MIRLVWIGAPIRQEALNGLVNGVMKHFGYD